ncbi:ATP-binding protein [Aureimonas ureilytica]|uniref:ATP-binding protein n=1 Tax=Aureimonas ureilytica TaxID=401562 RepID=UPI00035E7229|nr:ATP-binding protein [Aureimonas ureilytica]
MTPLDFMVLPAVRVANAIGSAVAVLSADLGAVLWCNAAGAALLALPAGRRSSGEEASSPLLPQIGLARETLKAKRRTQLLLRPADAGMGRAVLARLEVIGEDGALALLTVRLEGAASETREAFARRLIGEAELTQALACVVSDQGFVWGTPRLPAEEHSLLAAQGAEFLDAGEERLTVEDEFGALSFAKVAEGLVLIHIDAPEAEVEPGVAAPALGEADEWDALASPPAPEQPEPLSAEPVLAADEPADPDAGHVTEPEPAARPESLPAFAPALDAEPVRFVWQIDEEGRFSSLSPDFAATVGPHSADVVGRAFTDVAQVYGFDETGEVARLLERRDTWSGRSILWPIEGTDRKAPVDLAALPVYSRDRRFEGFRGFGVVRPAEHVADPDALGLVLASGAPLRAAAAAAGPDASFANDGFESEADERAVFGRRDQPPTSEQAERRRGREAALSSAEEAAFRAIGAELGVSKRVAPPLPAPLRAPPPLPVLVEPEPDHEPDEEAAAPFAAHELEDMFDALPLAVLVQMGDRLLFANKRFFALTRYEDLDALEDAGGLDRLVLSAGEAGEGDEAMIQCGDGRMERARLHLQRVSVAGRSCLLMSFTETREPSDDLLAGAVVDLQREVEELQAVLDTATDGILLLDGEERVRKMNGAAEALFGLSPDLYLGLPFLDLLAPDSRQTASDYIGTLRDNGLAAILNDGREVTAKVGPDTAHGGEPTTIPLFVTLGRLSDGRGWCVVIRDIAQWKQAEKDLVEARQQAEDASLHKSRFLANVSHELRTPLNAIIGFADVMASECFGPIGHERYLEYLGDIKRSGHHVLDLVNDLLDISKIEAGKIDLTFESVSLHEVVAEVVSLMQPQANRERVIVRSVLPASVPPVVADRRSVRQIALNLIANAVRFTPAGGQIVASTHYGEDGAVCLRVRDSGIGMTDQEVEIALTPFQQVKAGGRGEGTGLGLPLTKAMVEANRAQFSIASTPGEGTLVEIVFPPPRVLAV